MNSNVLPPRPAAAFRLTTICGQKTGIFGTYHIAAAEELAPALAQMQGLRRIWLDGNQLDDEMKSKLRAELTRVQDLVLSPEQRH